MAAKKKITPPAPALPGEIWRGRLDLGHGRDARLCAVALPDTDVPRWTYLDFDPYCPTVAVWFVDAVGQGDWVMLDESDHGLVYAACIRALRNGPKP